MVLTREGKGVKIKHTSHLQGPKVLARYRRIRRSRLDLPFFPGHGFSARVTALPTLTTETTETASVGKSGRKEERNNNLTFERPENGSCPEKRRKEKEMDCLSGGARNEARVRSVEIKMGGRDNWPRNLLPAAAAAAPDGTWQGIRRVRN